MFSIQLSNQKDLLRGNQPLEVQQIFQIDENDNFPVLCLRQGGRILGLKYSAQSEQMVSLWNQTVFPRDITYPTQYYPWTVTSDVIQGKTVVAIKTPDGVRFYELKPGSLGLKLLKEDLKFSDVYGYELNFGNLYRDPNTLGLMARSPRGEMSFFAATPDSLLSDDFEPLMELNVQLNLDSLSKSKSTDLWTAAVLNKSPDVVILRSASGIKFYQFDENYSLVKILDTAIGAKTPGIDDKIYFANVTNRKFKDMLHLNPNGLYLYSYNGSDYSFIQNHEGFTKDHGWSNIYTDSLVFLDIDRNGLDDLVFTGPKGLNVMSFNDRTKKWVSLLDNNSLNSGYLYSDLVGVLLAGKTPIAFVQKHSGEVSWGRVIPYVPPATPPPTPTEVSPTEPTPRELKICPVSTSINIGSLKIDPKPTLRWEEQWEPHFIRDSLQVIGGKSSFSLPLIDTFATSGWGIKFDLSYSSSVSATLLGEGWGIPIGQDYISVKEQGNILSPEHKYVFVLQGQELPLEFVSDANGVQKYRSKDRSLDKYNTSFEFHERERKWIVEDHLEKTVYGLSDDALRWSLSWPNWSGPGTDKTSLQPEIIAWYLRERSNKYSGQQLVYSYRQDETYFAEGRKYTTAIWLTAIEDGVDMRMNFEYGPKAVSEYTKYSPNINEREIRFPVALLESNYLRSVNISTSSYKQNFNFHYTFLNQRRFLSFISQEDEHLVNFKYDMTSASQYLSKMEVPYLNSTVTFQYDTYKIPNHIFKFPVKEEPKIANGRNYTILGYRNINTRGTDVVLEVLNPDMSQTLQDCTHDLNFSCPSSSSTKSKSLEIIAFENSFVVKLATETGTELYVYNRQTGVWSKEPQLFRFNNEAVLQFNNKGFAVYKKDENNIAFFFNKGSNWVQNDIQTNPSSRIARLENHFITYDNRMIRIFYTDKDSWKEKTIYEIPGKYAENFAEKFDWDFNTTTKIVQTLEQNTLQVTDNTIALSAITENSGQLFSEINLFLLNSDLGVAKHHEFSIKRQNLYDIKQEKELEQDDTHINLEIGYVIENGKFVIRVKDISGRSYDDLPENQKHEVREKFIEEGNKHIKENARKGILFDLMVFFNYKTNNGIICNDTMIQFTGTEWEKGSVPSETSLNLGTAFNLLISNHGKTVKLINQENNQKLKEFTLYSRDKLVNAYPLFIAYQTTVDVVEVLSFKDDKTLGTTYTYAKEQLLSNNNGMSLLTVANVTGSSEPMELRVRPATAFAPNNFEHLINMTEHTAGELKRRTGYRRSITVQDNPYVISREFTQFPDNNPDEHGWYTVKHTTRDGNTTTTEKWYNNIGEEVSKPTTDHHKKNHEETSSLSPTLLYDRGGRWIISNFSPFKLKDEMVAFYGFEDYESKEMFPTVSKNDSQPKLWNFINAEIIKDMFSFTGKNYLQLKGTSGSSYMEGQLQPKNQNISYVASCWLRSNLPLELNAPTSILKAVITTLEGEEIIGLLGEIKNQEHNWSYVEVILDFRVIREVYKQYIEHKRNYQNILLANEQPLFKVTIRVEATSQQTIDLDHIRFTPLKYNFKANVFNPFSGQETENIHYNGLITRHYFNRFGENTALIKENGDITLKTYSRTGKLKANPFSAAIGSSKPSVITFNSHTGYRESFDPRDFCNRWSIDEPEAWKFNPGQIWHTDSNRHAIVAEGGLFDPQSSVLKFYFNLIEGYSYLNLLWKEFASLKIYRWSDASSTLTFSEDVKIKPLPSSGEIIIKIDHNYVWIWFNGVLIFDEKLVSNSSLPWSGFSIEAKGHVLVEEIISLKHPSVKVEYVNGFGEKTQVVELDDVNSVLVRETLYDELGREAISTKKTRIYRTRDEDLLSYRPNFVTNKDPHDQKSVWNTGKLEGEINILNPADEGFAYTRTKFATNPLNEKVVMGMPGKDFSVHGKYSTKVNRTTDIDFINNLFPRSQGYYHRVHEMSNGSKRILVFDKKNNQVAHYMRVAGHDHSLSTYEYDSHNRLVKILPPAYHEKANTAGRITPWKSELTNSFKNSPVNDAELQELLGVHLHYDKKGNLLRKKTPDTNTVEMKYNHDNQPTLLTYSGEGVNHTVFMKYDERGQLWHTGYIRTHSGSPYQNSRKEFKTSQAYQKFYYSYNEVNPLKRGRFKQCITEHGNETVVEKLHFDLSGQVISKSTIASFYINDDDKFNDFKKEYKGDKVHVLTYPITYKGEPLRVVHTYNRLGQLVGLGKANNLYSYAKFTYEPDGQLASIQHLLDTPHSFKRLFKYNSPGFIEKLSDPYLTESLSYIDGGYGQDGFGDGMAMRTFFNASWTKNADARWFQLREEYLDREIPLSCIRALKRLGYISVYGQPLKMLFPTAEIKLPLACGGRTAIKLAQSIAQKLPVLSYGHMYTYGNHQELTKAKYFTGETISIIEPLQISTFSKHIPKLSDNDSTRIFQSLTNSGFIIVDQNRDDPSAAIGKRGSSFLRDNELRENLAQLSIDFTLYLDPIKRLLSSAIGQRQQLSIEDFVNIFLQWEGVDESTSRTVYNRVKESGARIGEMLLNNGYFPSNNGDLNKILNDDFINSLIEYKHYIPEIVRILSLYFNHALGESAFDVESYNIDANGNHKLFYNGFDRFELSYKDNSNQVHSIQLNGYKNPNEKNVLFMKHDHRGNVIQALHKGIKLIEYHPVSQRTTRIQLVDGSELRFYYDTNGERVLKRFSDPNGKIKHETHYLRDEKGRVLMDKRVIYRDGKVKKTVSAYLYGPKGLFGFIRGDSVYSVISDHSRSVRLVIKDGRVAAAYDYLPYGQIMRIFGDDPEAHIYYRYIGQEWDEEIGLYNFHARLYDPAIGRFFQPDPKMQYFSPYKYSGNSPVSITDPDGEFAWFFVFIIVFAVAGAYLGGAAANGSWNPIKWNWKSLDTWAGIILGGINGALLPLSYEGVGLIAVGLELTLNFASTYVSLAAQSGSWNPAKWNWASPEIYDTLFSAFMLSGSFKGISSGKKLIKGFKDLVSRKKILKSLLSVAHEVGVLYTEEMVANMNPKFWEWDFSDPQTIDVFLSGIRGGLSSMGRNKNKFNRYKGITKKLEKAQTIIGKGFKVLDFVMGHAQDFEKNGFNLVDYYQDYVKKNQEETDQNDDSDEETDDGSEADTGDDSGIDSAEDSHSESAEDTHSESAEDTHSGSTEDTKSGSAEDSPEVSADNSGLFESIIRVHNKIRRRRSAIYDKLTSNKSHFSRELIDFIEADVPNQYIYPDREARFLSCTHNSVNGACFLNMHEYTSEKNTHPNITTRPALVRNSSHDVHNQVTHTTSGSGKPQFWAYRLIGSALSFLPFLSYRSHKQGLPEGNVFEDSFDRKIHKIELLATQESQQNQNYSYEFVDNTPTVLEMGDEIVKHADVNGFLLWCNVLARKVTGYKPGNSRIPTENPYNNIQFAIRSNEIVEEFSESLFNFLYAIGVDAEKTEKLISVKIYNGTVAEVRHKLAKGDAESIPDLIYDRLVQKNIHQIALMMTGPTLKVLLKNMQDKILKLKDRLKSDERHWFDTCAESFGSSMTCAKEDIQRDYSQSRTLDDLVTYSGDYPTLSNERAYLSTTD